MLGSIICWGIALGIMLSEANNFEILCIRTLLAMGFIFLGILSKAVDVYRETHIIELDEETLEQIKKNT